MPPDGRTEKALSAITSANGTVQPLRLMLLAEEAAEACGVSLRTWRRLDSAGKIPAPVRIGRMTRWPAETLKAWVEAGCPDRKLWKSIYHAR